MDIQIIEGKVRKRLYVYVSTYTYIYLFKD